MSNYASPQLIHLINSDTHYDVQRWDAHRQAWVTIFTGTSSKIAHNKAGEYILKNVAKVRIVVQGCIAEIQSFKVEKEPTRARASRVHNKRKQAK